MLKYIQFLRVFVPGRLSRSTLNENGAEFWPQELTSLLGEYGSPPESAKNCRKRQMDEAKRRCLDWRLIINYHQIDGWVGKYVLGSRAPGCRDQHHMGNREAVDKLVDKAGIVVVGNKSASVGFII